MPNEHTRAPILELFKTIQSDFPDLTTVLTTEHEQVDAMLEIPEQTGLAFAVSLYLDGDVLHLCAGDFRSLWFPSGSEECREEYLEAVTGVLSGAYRIVEHFAGRVPVKKELQRPVGDGWKTIYTAHGFGCRWLPWRRTKRIVQNRHGGRNWLQTPDSPGNPSMPEE